MGGTSPPSVILIIVLRFFLNKGECMGEGGTIIVPEVKLGLFTTKNHR